MKTFATLLIAATALSCFSLPVAAREYVVHNIGKKGLESSCGRGGGEFVETEGGYHCGYKNGNIRECSNSTKKCVMITPNLVGTGEDDGSSPPSFDYANVASFN